MKKWTIAIALIFFALSVIGFNFYKRTHQNVKGTQTESRYKYVNPKSYEQSFANPQWYLDPKTKSLIDSYIKADESTKTQAWKDEKHEFIQMIGDFISENKIALGRAGSITDMDEDRLPIDTIVIHHTQTAPDINRNWLNGLQMLTLYVPVFSNPSSDNFGKPITSGHFDSNGNNNFIAYHYLVYRDGTVVHNLNDNQIGWQAGNWQMNRHSIAIAFIDDLTNSSPTPQALAAAKKIIDSYREKNPKIKVIGHKEVEVGHTQCPGNKFDEWKHELL